MAKWFENWFDENYLELYQHRDGRDADRQVSLIIDTLKLNKDMSILDLACGEGRHSIYFHLLGYNIEGIDLSPTLITRGKEKYPDLNIHTGNMLHIEGTFDVILSLFTSFGYYSSDEENQQVLESISTALKPGGWFWMDFLNAYQVENNLVPLTVSELDNGTRVEQHRSIQDRMVVKDIIFFEESGSRSYQERVMLYTKTELEAMFFKAGLKPAGSFGDYTGAAWTRESRRTILYAKKVTNR